MGFLDSVKNLLKREAAEVSDVAKDATSGWESALDRKEREMNASPAEKLNMLQEEIEESNPLDAVRSKIEHRAGHADAVAEIADAEDFIEGEVVEDDSSGGNSW